MIIKNALVYTPEQAFVRKDLVIRNERIVFGAAPQLNEEVIDAEGLYALPGLLDLHFHGAVGHDFCDASEEAIQALADFEASKGVLAICPATMTYSEEILGGIADAAAAHHNGRGADLVGHQYGGVPSSVRTRSVHRIPNTCTGPMWTCSAGSRSGQAVCSSWWIWPPRRRAHWTLSLSAATRCASPSRTPAPITRPQRRRFAAGASHMTHLYNAMPGITHRAPGPIIAALEEGAEVELITDGVHIHPAMVRFTFRVFGSDRVILIADSMMACGLPDGQYSLGGQAVTVKGPRATLTEHPGVIAGSATCLYDCMRRAVLDMDVPLVDAVRAASENPARSIGVDGDYGSLTPGTVWQCDSG